MEHGRHESASENDYGEHQPLSHDRQVYLLPCRRDERDFRLLLFACPFEMLLPSDGQAGSNVSRPDLRHYFPFVDNPGVDWLVLVAHVLVAHVDLLLSTA